jgi:hypothetical protein
MILNDLIVRKNVLVFAFGLKLFVAESLVSTLCVVGKLTAALRPMAPLTLVRTTRLTRRRKKTH